MSNTAPSPLREAEILSPEQIARVREHVEEILSSRTLAGSRRTQDFLRLIVTHALEGETESLRERMIGAELFGRPVGYDTGNDSVVRVRASEVRRKLAQYYSTESPEQEPSIRIELPSGSYVPRFHFAPADNSTNVTNAQPSVPAPSLPLPPHSQTSAGPLAQAVEMPRWLRRYPRALPIVLVCVSACILLGLSGVIAIEKWRGSSAASKGIHSIAVLPFENLSGSPSQDYFADGLTEELINDLGQVSTLRIISLTSSMSFKGTQKKLPEIARDLSVEGIVEGGVLRDGNQVRISVQLIDARTDRPVWASTYVQDVTSVFAWQGEVAQSIAEEISTKVTPQEQARLDRRSPVDPQAQDLYLHGLLLRNASDCKRAIDEFQQAIAGSPGYAQAHSALASCYGMLGESGQMPYQEAFTEQKAEALKAIALDDSLSEAHAELANTAMTLDWNWPVAAAQFREALALNPSSATSHEKYAFYLVRTGHPQEAIAEIERSVDLDPVSASTFHAEGFIYYFAHQYDQARSVTRTVRGLNINLPDWNFLLGAVYAAKDQYPEAIRAFLQSGNGPYSLGHLGNAYARAGQTGEARNTIPLLEDDVRRDGVGRYEIALVYAGLGENDQAFHWLEDAWRAHDVGLVYLRVDPCLDPLRSDPRFADLLQRIGLGPS
jgi:TolB-like protein/Flp pilus assembly protein TadD